MPRKNLPKETSMLKNLLAILVLFTCLWTVRGQTALPLRKDVQISMDLYWSKSFDLIEDNRFVELEKLLTQLVQSSLGICANFDNEYNKLSSVLNNSALKTFDSQKALTEFITILIVYEVQRIHPILDPRERKERILGLFKELIVIQKYIKDLDFDTYRQLVNCFRRLNQLSGDPEGLKQFVDRQEFLSKYAIKC